MSSNSERDRLAVKYVEDYRAANGNSVRSPVHLGFAFEAGFTAGENSERVRALVEVLEYANYVANEYCNYMSGPNIESKAYKLNDLLRNKSEQALTQFKGGV